MVRSSKDFLKIFHIWSIFAIRARHGSRLPLQMIGFLMSTMRPYRPVRPADIFQSLDGFFFIRETSKKGDEAYVHVVFSHVFNFHESNILLYIGFAKGIIAKSIVQLNPQILHSFCLSRNMRF